MIAVVEIQCSAGRAALGAGIVATEHLRDAGIRVISYLESGAETTIRLDDCDLDRAIELLRAAGFAARTTG